MWMSKHIYGLPSEVVFPYKLHIPSIWGEISYKNFMTVCERVEFPHIFKILLSPFPCKQEKKGNQILLSVGLFLALG